MEIEPRDTKYHTFTALDEEDFTKNYDIYKSNYELYCDRIRYWIIRNNILSSLVHNDRFKVEEDLSIDPAIKFAAKIIFDRGFGIYDDYHTDYHNIYVIYFTQFLSSTNSNDDYYAISIDCFMERDPNNYKEIYIRAYDEVFMPNKNFVHVSSNILESDKFNMKTYNSACNLLSNLMVDCNYSLQDIYDPNTIYRNYILKLKNIGGI
jgi:hypothetical protein